METPFFLLLLQMAQYNNVMKNSYPRGGETPSLHPIAAAPQAMTLGRGFSFSRSILGPTRPPSCSSPSRKLQFLPAKDPPVLWSLLSSLVQKKSRIASLLVYECEGSFSAFSCVTICFHCLFFLFLFSSKSILLIIPRWSSSSPPFGHIPFIRIVRSFFPESRAWQRGLMAGIVWGNMIQKEWAKKRENEGGKEGKE